VGWAASGWPFGAGLRVGPSGQKFSFPFFILFSFSFVSDFCFGF
jgi:hypothetical protein